MRYVRPNAILWTGGALLLLALVTWLFDILPFPGTRFPAWVIPLALGLSLSALGASLKFNEIQAAFGHRTARYWFNAVVGAALAVGIITVVSVLAIRHAYRWDLTENRRHSLSSQTIKILQSLPTDVTATAFFRTDQPGKRTAEELFRQYESYSGGKFKAKTVDPDREPGLARRYAVETYGTIVLETKTKSEKVLDAEEEKFTNGLLKVTRAGKRVVYVVKGHGEREVTRTDRPGLSEAKAAMERANYEVKDLLLARDGKVPDDAALVLVPGPKTDLFPPELDALDKYIARGGKALFTVDPFRGEGMKKYLAKYGITLGDDLVIEINPVGQLFGIGPQVPVVSQYDPHPITKEMGGLTTLFPLTRSVTPAKTPPKGVTLQPLAQTSDQSWGETDPLVLQKEQASRDPHEKRGPLPVAVVATIDATTPAGGKKDAKARLVVLGTSDLASNQYLGAAGNRDFFLNAVSWLAEEEDLIAIRPKDLRVAPVILTAAQEQVIRWLSLVILPGAAMLCGIAVILRRRKSS
ncbi:MAG: GldG family protein [Candidatus Rokubacteria bacterium]|nr:GldG family protein [Candidatus Rokubacteria bacterium]MBI2544914.1 GldG family protein [Candidatus Rokubacteria bacterium]